MDHVDHGSVLVTGGSGYLAGWIVVALLKEGRRLRATVRDMARADAVRASLARHAPVDRLTFYAADLLADAGWDAPTDGTEHVIHVASPMPVREYKDQDLVAPAREGTRRVLSAAHRAGVRHVVMTSSVVARIVGHGGRGRCDDERMLGLDTRTYASSKISAMPASLSYAGNE